MDNRWVTKEQASPPGSEDELKSRLMIVAYYNASRCRCIPDIDVSVNIKRVKA